MRAASHVLPAAAHVASQLAYARPTCHPDAAHAVASDVIPTRVPFREEGQAFGHAAAWLDMPATVPHVRSGHGVQTLFAASAHDPAGQLGYRVRQRAAVTSQSEPVRQSLARTGQRAAASSLAATQQQRRAQLR